MALLLNLAVDYEQDASNDCGDPCDQIHRETSKMYSQKYQAIQDQENAQQNPFETTHFDAPFDENLPESYSLRTENNP